MKAEELDKIFDDGKEDMSPHLDMSTLRRPNLNQKRVNVDLPTWMIQRLDRQASLIGVTRQSIIKVWLSERIKEEYAERYVAPNPGGHRPPLQKPATSDPPPATAFLSPPISLILSILSKKPLPSSRPPV